MTINVISARWFICTLQENLCVKEMFNLFTLFMSFWLRLFRVTNCNWYIIAPLLIPKLLMGFMQTFEWKQSYVWRAQITPMVALRARCIVFTPKCTNTAATMSRVIMQPDETSSPDEQKQVFVFTIRLGKKWCCSWIVCVCVSFFSRCVQASVCQSQPKQ